MVKKRVNEFWVEGQLPTVEQVATLLGKRYLSVGDEGLAQLVTCEQVDWAEESHHFIRVTGQFHFKGDAKWSRVTRSVLLRW